MFEFWDTLDIGEQASLLKTLATIDPMKCNRTFERSTAPVSGSNATITPLPESIYGSLVDSNQDQKNSWNEIGLNSIARNQVAVILLAGGQGTRLGSSAPKVD